MLYYRRIKIKHKSQLFYKSFPDVKHSNTQYVKQEYRDRQTDQTDRDRETQKERNRQTGRQTDRDRQRQTDRKRNGGRERERTRTL